jgi:hypothetical protein
MTLDEFTVQAGEDQIAFIKAKGALVGKRFHTHHYIHLYQIDNFYTEVFLRNEDDTIWKVGAFDHPILLQPYLDQVDISSLLR